MEINGIPVRSLFSLNKDVLHFNCGAYGVTPTDIIKLRHSIEEEIEAEPDRWIRHTYHHRFNEAADFLADLYKAPKGQMTLVPNVTYAISAILNCLDLCSDDELLITSLTYGTMRMQCEDLVKKCGVKLRCLDVEFPPSHESVIKQYEEEFEKMCGKRKLALIDHISTAVSFLMPLQAILQLCKKFNVLSLVDAAHAPGQLTPSEMDLSQLQPDFYTGDLHKWAFVPRPCALLYVAEKFTAVIRQQVISWFHNESFRQRFAVTGTTDGAPVACIIPAFQFADRLGGSEVIQSFVKSLLREGVKHVMEKLETTSFCNEKHSAPFMMAIYLGTKFDERLDMIEALKEGNYQPLMFSYLREHAKLSTTAINVYKRRCVFRISAHVFTTMEDFHKLADGLLNLRNHIQTLTPEDIASLETYDYSRK